MPDLRAVCVCPACKYERSGSSAPYIPVGRELLEELDAHPKGAPLMAERKIEKVRPTVKWWYRGRPRLMRYAWVTRLPAYGAAVGNAETRRQAERYMRECEYDLVEGSNG